MNKKTLNIGQIWKQFEDSLAPRLRLSTLDRAVYLHLLRHSRLEGKERLRFSILWLARNIGITGGPVRESVRRLAEQGALRVVERSKAGHVVEVKLPEEIRGAWPTRIESPETAGREGAGGRTAVDIEEADFLQDRVLRKTIHAREGGQCFYCMRRITPTTRCLDHVVPRAQAGRNSYRNLVSSCMECNSNKGEKPAVDFLRRVYREARLTAMELNGRLQALKALAAGNLRPPLPTPAKPAPRAH
jgi:HNH endonuclease